MTFLEFLKSFNPQAADAVEKKIADFEAAHPDAAPALDAVLAEVGGAFTPESLGALVSLIPGEVVGVKGGFRPVHHASDGGS